MVQTAFAEKERAWLEIGKTIVISDGIVTLSNGLC
jgi:hypothetical protein